MSAFTRRGERRGVIGGNALSASVAHHCHNCSKYPSLPCKDCEQFPCEGCTWIVHDRTKKWCSLCAGLEDHETRNCWRLKSYPTICIHCGAILRVGQAWDCQFCEVSYRVSQHAIITIEPSVNVGPECIHSTRITIEPKKQEFIETELLQAVVTLAGTHDLSLSLRGHALTDRAYFDLILPYARHIEKALSSVLTPWKKL